MMAVGVASPRASGQVMTTTVMANSSASWTSRPTTKYQTTKVRPPPTSATSTSQNAALVGEPLAGRLGVLGFLDELDDLRERGVRADGGRAGAQGAVLVDGRADELIAGGPS